MTGHRSDPEIDARAMDRLHRLGGDELVRRVIDICLARLPVKIQEVRDQLERKDFKGVANAAHSLKSSAGNVGAITLVKLAERIESLTLGEAEKEILTSLHELEQVYDSTRIYLQEQRKGPKE